MSSKEAVGPDKSRQAPNGLGEWQQVVKSGNIGNSNQSSNNIYRNGSSSNYSNYNVTTAAVTAVRLWNGGGDMPPLQSSCLKRREEIESKKKKKKRKDLAEPGRRGLWNMPSPKLLILCQIEKRNLC